MIFAHTLPYVLSRCKTQTRRLVKQGEYLREIDGTFRVESDRRVVYQIGKEYAIQPGRGKAAVARLLLTGLRREPVESISTADAIAEGFPSRDAFLNTWRAIHGDNADLAHEVWVLEFVLQPAPSTLRDSHERESGTHRRTHNRDDVSPSVTRASGTGVHSGVNS